MREVRDNIFVETGFRGCNVGFVITNEGIVMIDTPQRPTEALKWREEISKRGEVRYLINTEHHLDHCTGNFFFPGTILAHKGTRDELLKESKKDVEGSVRQIDPGELFLLGDYSLRLPTITFTESLELHLGNLTFCLMHLPGHTPSETAVFIPEKRVIFSGDNIFYQIKSYLQQAEPWLWLESLKKLKELEVDFYVPGHGEGTCDKAYLEQQTAIVQAWIEVVKSAIKQGLSMEEAIAKIRCPDPYPMPKGREARAPEVDKMNITRLYEVLSPDPP